MQEYNRCKWQCLIKYMLTTERFMKIIYNSNQSSKFDIEFKLTQDTMSELCYIAAVLPFTRVRLTDLMDRVIVAFEVKLNFHTNDT